MQLPNRAGQPAYYDSRTFSGTVAAQKGCRAHVWRRLLQRWLPGRLVSWEQPQKLTHLQQHGAPTYLAVHYEVPGRQDLSDCSASVSQPDAGQLEWAGACSEAQSGKSHQEFA